MRSAMMLWASLVVILARRASSQVIDGCFVDLSCNSPTESSFADAESCCVASTPLAYTVGGACTSCQVVGWLETEVTLEETGMSTQLMVGIAKGSPTVPFFRANVVASPGTAQAGFDYSTPLPTAVTYRSALPNPASVLISAQGDRVSQEGNETFTISLTAATPSPAAGVFYRTTLNVIIEDRTTVTISWTELDYGAPESRGVMVGTVQTNNEIAAPIVVTATPLTYTQLAARGFTLRDNLPFESEVNDFDTRQLEVEIPVQSGTINQVDVMVGVVDDERDEVTDEGFVVLLELKSAPFPDLVVFDSESRVTLARVLDNDETLIGFEFPSYEFNERAASAVETIRLQKETMSDLTVFVVVSVLATQTPPGAQQAARDSDYSLIDSVVYTFRPEDTFADVQLTVLADVAVEMREGLVLSVDETDASPAVLPGANPTTNVYILDDDAIVVGFSQLTYTFSEGVGSGSVCVSVTTPSQGVPDGISFNILFSTSIGSADATDFTGLTDFTVAFSSMDTERCVDVAITPDLVLELNESFTATLSLPSPAPAFPPVTITPAETTVTILNDDTVTFNFNPVDYPVSEGSPANLMVVLTGETAISVTVDLNTQDGSAVAGADYTTVTQTLTFNAGETSQTVAVETLSDQSAEDSEQFTAVLSNPSTGGVVGTANIATVTISDGTVVMVELAPPTFSIGEDDGSAVFRVNKLTTTSRTISVLFSTTDGTAIAGSDYRAVSDFVVTFAPSETSQEVSVPIIDDEVFESDEESFTGSLSLTTGSSGVGLGQRTSVATIEDDDEVVIGFSQDNYMVNENDGSATLTVAIATGTIDQGLTVTVNFFTTFTFSAAENDDYTALNMALSFSSTTTSIPVAVAITDDDVLEMNELFAGSLQLPAGASERVTIRPGSTVVNIVDDDSVTFNFNPVDYPVSEGSPANLMVVLTGETAISVTVDLNTQDGSAVAGADYTTVTQTLTFNAGETSQTVTVETLSDQSAEDSEQFTAVLSNPSTGGVVGTANVATVTISDGTVVMVELAPATFSIGEDDGSAVFRVNKLTTTSRTISVLFSTTDGTAIAGSDYRAVSDFMVTFAPSETSQEVSVPIIDDEVFESDEESFTGSLSLTTGSSGVGLGQRTSVATIEDNDQVVIGFSQNNYMVNENDGSATLTVAIATGTIDQGLTVTVNFFTTFTFSAAEDDDYTALNMALSFSSTTTSIPVAVAITDDDVLEMNELFAGSLQLPAGASERVTIRPGSTVVNIVDDDSVTFNFNPVDYPVSEGSPANLMVVLTGETAISVTVDLNTQDGSAVASQDYTGVTRTLSFGPGDTSVTVSVTTLTDQSAEDSEEFTAVLSNPSMGGVIGTADTATVTINDGTAVIVTLNPTSFSVGEDDGSAVFTVNKLTTTSRTISVLFSTTDGTAIAGDDYEAVVARTVTFAPSDLTQTVQVPVLNDELLERDETFTGSLSLVAGSMGVELQDDVATATITDEDAVIVQFDPASYTVEEGGVVNFRVVLVGNTNVPVTATFSTADGSAIAPGDYTSQPGTMVIFDPGETLQMVAVPTTEDQVAESEEGFSGRLTLLPGQPRVTLGDAMAAATITDNDDVVVQFQPVDYSVMEGGSTMLTVVLSTPAVNTITVQVSTQDGSAQAPGDYVPLLSQVVTFNPGQMSRTVTVTTEGDQAAESSEQFTVVLSNPSDGVTIGSNNVATVTITDTTDVVVELDPVTYQVTEGQDTSVRFRVVKRTPTTRTVEVLFTTQDLSAIAPGDYTARSDVTVTFAPTETEQEVTVSISNDVVYEGAEEFRGQIRLPLNSERVQLGTSQATVTISDDDSITVGFEREVYTVTEPSSGSSQLEVCVVVLSGQLGQALDLRPQWTQGTALETLDYQSPIGDFMLLPSTGTQRPRACLSGTVLSDDLLEAQEEFTARLVGVVSDGGMLDSDPDRVTFEPRDVRILINDDTSERVTIGFERTAYTVAEPDSSPSIVQEVCMTLTSGRLGRDFIVELQFTGRTAQMGPSSATSDFDPVDESVLFTPAVSRVCADVSIFNDNVVEPTEDFVVTVRGFRNSPTDAVVTNLQGVTVNPSRATVDITDSDNLVLGFEQPMYTFLEPNPGTSQRTEEICMVIVEGVLESSAVLTVTPRWTAGTASVNVDYRAPTQSYIFRSGSRRECLDLIVLQDTVFELPETLNGELTDVLINSMSVLMSPRIRAVPMETDIVIEDTDAITVGFEFPTHNFPEPASSFQQRPVCMVLTGRPSFDLTVGVNWVPGTATPGAFGADYNPASNSYLFRQGTSRACINIQIFSDNRFEPDETFSGQVAGIQLPGGTLESEVVGISVAPAQTTVTIEDMDAVTIGFVSPTLTFDEPPPGSNQQAHPVCVQISSGNVGIDVIVEVQWTPGTAVAGFGQDYLPPIASYLLRPSTSRACVDLTVLNDILLEDTETLQARLVRATDSMGNVLSDRVTLDPNIVDISIRDNDPVTLGFERASYTVSEPGMASQVTQEVCLVVSQGSIGRNLIVIPAWMEGTAREGVPSQSGDYVPSLDRFSFSPGASRACVELFVFQDTVFELTEDLSVSVDGFIDSEGDRVASLTGVTVRPDRSTIAITDTNQLVIGFRREFQTVMEPNPGVSQSREQICIDVTEGAVGTTITIVPVWTAGSATEGFGGDYLEPTQRYTLNPMATSDCVELTVLNDNLFERTEDLTGSLGEIIVGGMTFQTLPRVTLRPVQTTIDIEDTDAVTIGFAEPSYSVVEPTSGTTTQRVCVEVTIGTLGRQLRIVPAWPGDTATEGVLSEGGDYSPAAGNFILNSGDTMSCLDILVNNDNLFEVNEEFRGQLTGFIDDGGFPASTISGVTLDPDETTVTIEDSDVVVIGFEEEEYMFSEPAAGGGAREEMVCVVLSGSEITSRVRVQARWSDVTATVNEDYTTALNQFTLEAGETRDCVRVTILEDDQVETLESFRGQLLSLVGPDGNLLPPSTRVTLEPSMTDVSIADTNMVVIGFERGSYNVSEVDGFVDVRVLIVNGELSRPVEVTVTATDGTAMDPDDYVFTQRTLNFMSPLSVSHVVRVFITDDVLDDDGESFTLSLSVPMAEQDTVQLAPRTTVVTIIDDDVFCDDLTALENGMIEYDEQASPRPEGTVATHSCNEGFSLDGVVERVCLETGQFSETPPTCEPIVCSELPALENGMISYGPDSEGPDYDLSTVATYTCNQGFALVGEDQMRTCMDVSNGTTGEFNGTAPMCQPIVCSELPALENGMISYGPDSEGPEYDLSTVATYTCDVGFALVGGNRMRTCEDVSNGPSGEFNGTAPTCQPIVCSELPEIENGMISYGPDSEGPDYDLSTVATYTCDVGFALVGGNRMRTCEDVSNGPSGEFNGTAPTCQPIVCSELPEIENGMISYGPDSEGPDYDLSTVATYNCDEGFALVGEDRVRTCVDVSSGRSGEFNGTAPMCQPIVCSELPAIENGMISYGPDSEGPDYDLSTVATYNCDEGFALVGEDQMRTCVDVSNGLSGDFNGTAPSCQAIVCSELPAIDNGMISYGPDSEGPDYDLSTVGTYTCDVGFELVGEDQIRTCVDVSNGLSGKFNGTAPICQEIVCNELDDIENGMISYSPDSEGPEYSLNTVATYNCSEGFMLIGSAQRTCESSGNFSEMEPICSMIPVCQDLPPLENGEIVYSSEESPRAVGTVATHRCNPGFVLVGVINRTCEENTEFSSSPPTCEPIVCSELPALENGAIYYIPDNEGPDYNLGTVATYTCNVGFALVGEDRTRTCEDVSNGLSGEFNGTAPTCQPIVCSELPTLENGMISYGPDSEGPDYDLSTVATYTCNERFAFVGGDRMRTCVDVSNGPSGEFNGTAPTCEAIVCSELPALENGMISYGPDSEGPDYDLSTVATYTCDEGFALVGGDRMRTCVDVSNGPSREFNGTAPTCQAIVCSELPALENGMISYGPDSEGPDYDLNTVATYTCDVGFELVGEDQMRTCVDVSNGLSGEFNGTAPTCQEIVCDELDDIENGMISYSPDSEGPEYSLNTVATYNCSEGFMLVGSAQRTCESSGNFSGMEPICSMIPVCQDLPPLENGEIVYSSEESPRAVGTVATHRCNPGFVLVGVINRTCEENTDFSGSLPTCEPIVCSELPALENGMISYGPDSEGPVYDLSTVATYNCNVGFVLVGEDRTRTCDDVSNGLSGEFNGTAPTCQSIVCSELPALENGMISYGPDSEGPEYDLSTVATYTCNEGFALVGGDRMRTCVDVSNGPSGEFNGTAPTCQAIVCSELPALENGMISYSPDNEGPEYSLNTVATYNCSEGFMLVGSAQRTCESSSNFSGMEPICSMIPVCQDLPPLENGEIVYSSEESPRAVGTVATHRCNPGFVLVGDVNRTCEESTEFNSSPPTCEPIVCSELPALENGMISYGPDSEGPDYDLSTVATYTCNIGFALVGEDQMRTCVDVSNGLSGEFNGTAPTCEEIVCDELDDIENGMISYSPDNEGPEYNLNTVATYNCSEGFMLVGSAQRTCESSGNFSGVEPICSMISVCQDLPPLENGEIVYSSEESPRAVGTVATHRCNPGFVLVGVVNRTCEENTEFSGSPPTCEPIICSELPALENGMISYGPDSEGPDYDLSTVATYTCNEGFALVGGNRMRTCVDVSNGPSGEFNGTTPTCQAIVCSELPALENGMITYGPDSEGPDYDLSTVATYNCDEGFVLVGEDKIRTCVDISNGPSGEFNGTAPSCEEIICDELDDIENGMISYSPDSEGPQYNLNTVATYNCSEGFMLIGSAQRTCESSGNFSGMKPICSMIPVCQDLLPLENGEIVYSSEESPRAVGTVATHRCNPGFVLVGVVNRTCEQSTEFSSSPPTCEPIVCSELPALENGAISYYPDNEGPDYNLGTVATYTCNVGYSLVGEDRTRTCEDVSNGLLGEFNGTAPTCQAIVCSGLPALENGMISYGPDSEGPDYDLSTVATYTCNEGFALVGGDRMRTCVIVSNGSSGEFNGTAPTCQAIVCSELPALENGMISYGPDSEGPEYSLNTVATYNCSEGFMLVGSAQRTCESSGNFSGVEPICSMIPVCQDLPPLENGEIVYSSEESPRAVGAVATHRCNPRFVLVGVINRTCEENTEFSGSPPTCEPVVCSELPALENGTISYGPDSEGPDYDLSTVATYTCTDGFALVGGDRIRTCVDVSNGLSGEFNGTAPTCQAIVCSELPALENGMISYGPDSEGPDYDLSTVATYNCNEGFVLVGEDKIRTCVDISNGEFNGTAPTCEEIVCDELDDIENGMISYSPDNEGPEYSLNTVATYNCSEGFMLVGSAQRTCESSGNFSGIEPICSMIPVCQDLPPLENGEIVYSSEESPRAVGTVATHRCNPGFVLVGVINRTCEENTEFSGSLPTCEPIVCSELPALENGTISYGPDSEGPDYDLSTVATYNCDEGFVLVGEDRTRTCDDVSNGLSGEFNGTAPTCQPIVCSELPALENGMISYGPDSEGPEYDLSTVATYTCNEGFALVGGDRMRTCVDVSNGPSGEFNRTAPTCQAIVCSELSALENGMISYGPDSEGPDYDLSTVATYNCSEEFMLVGSAQRTCESSGNFSGMEPICSMIPVCQDLPPLENGEIVYSSEESPRAVGTVATHRCNHGFVLVGDVNRTCEESTEFSSSPPTCEPIICSELPALENGMISYGPDSEGPDYDLSTVATYTCNEGFALVGGNRMRSCVDVSNGPSGEFNGTAPSCEEIICDELDDIENGMISYSPDSEGPQYNLNTVATYNCSEGFMLIGSAQRTCESSGNFSGMEPICSMIPVCQDLLPLENGEIVYSSEESPRAVGTVATHRCNPGFVLVGVVNRTCEQSTEFSSSPPTCEPIVCSELPALENGAISYYPDNEGPDYNLGTVATYTCNVGYSLVGEDRTRTCEDVSNGLLGEFNGTAPTCQAIVCSELPALENGMISYGPDSEGPDYDLSTVATYTCNEGFALVGGDRMRFCVIVSNGSSGEFNGTAPTCQAIVCSELPALENGMISYGPDSEGPEYSLNTVATYNCSEGFMLVGSAQRTCESSGNFSGMEPICSMISVCQDLPPLENGEIVYSSEESPRAVGTVATHRCNPGFVLVGDVNRTCEENTEFSSSPPTCEPIICSELPALENGMISYSPDSAGPDYDLSTVATYTCNEGFALVGGNRMRTCVDVSNGPSGEFNGTAPSCEEIVCDELDDIENGMISYSPDNEGPEYSLNTVATYNCSEGFMLVGSAQRTCESSGNFSGVEPICSMIPVCQDLPPLENGEIVYSSEESPRAVGTVATHTCNPGFVLVGVINRTCEENAEFSGSPPTCEPIVCSELLALENGMISYGPDSEGPDYDLGTLATYTCNQGFALVGEDQIRTCVDIRNGSNGNFNGTAPICQRIVCSELPTIDNGMISYSSDGMFGGPDHPLGTVATYTCNEGFDLVGDDVRVCEAVGNGVMGMFSGSSPICNRGVVSVMFVQREYTVSEDDGFVSIEITTDRPVLSPFTVRIVGGPTDQSNVVPSLPAVNTSVHIPANGIVINVTIPIQDDSISLETVERVGYQLELPEGVTGVTLGTPDVTYVNVIDDDVVIVELEDGMLTVSESEGNYTTCVVKNSRTVRPLEVQIADSAGTATANTDYLRLAPSFRVTLEPDTNRSCFSGDIIDDAIALEGDETFDLVLRDPMLDGVTVGERIRTVVVISDDDVVTTTLTRPEIRVSETTGTVMLCVTKDLETSEPFSVTLTTIDGTAMRGDDFGIEERFNITLGLEVGAMSCVNIAINDDSSFEDVENFRVSLSTEGTGNNIRTGEITMTTVLIDDQGPEVPFVNDTIVGDPLLTVRLTNLNLNGIDLQIEGQPSLCFEVHGEADQYFNLVTDNCVSVNARYHALNENWNVINQIAVRAVDDEGQCRNISVDLQGCSASVDGVPLTTPYQSNGISVRPYRRHVRVSVPNCNVSSHLVMYVLCQQNLTVEDPFTGEPFTASMIKYIIAHGLNLNENSHGLIGQFWNVPVDVKEYTGPIINDPETNRYEITVTHPDFSGERRFTGLLYNVNWEFERTPCFYAGNVQGGPIYEVEDPNDSVIEGEYKDYIVGGAFETEYTYGRFDSLQCTQ